MSTPAPRTGSDPTAVIESRLRWLDRRQAVLAQNIANADTPGYAPRDIAPFATVLAGRVMEPVRTNPHHLAPPGGPARAVTDRSGDRSPNGNAVSLDQQALLVAETDQQQALALGLDRRITAMFRLALGRG